MIWLKKQDDLWIVRRKLYYTYIFLKDFPLRGHPNIRVVIELTNDGGNGFVTSSLQKDFVKSNSTINPQFKLFESIQVSHLCHISALTHEKSVSPDDET